MGTWLLQDGTKVEGVQIKERFATGEYIVVNGEKILVNGNVRAIAGEHHHVDFDVWGLHTPTLRCSEIKEDGCDEFRDEWDSPKVFESRWKKYLKRPEFSGEVGQLMIARLQAILNYEFKL